MEDLRVLVTGGGSPGIYGTIESLKHNYDNRDITIITVDMKRDVPGKKLSDGFYQIKYPCNDNRYYKELYRIAASEDIDVILPQISTELYKLSMDNLNPGIAVAVSSPNSIRISSDKYLLLKVARSVGVATGKFKKLYTLTKLKKQINEINEHPFVIKPCISHGSRGLRVISKDAYDNNFYKKPNGMHITRQTMHEQLEGMKLFHPMLLMQQFRGIEYSVDCFRTSDSDFIAIPRKRLQIRSGISFECEVEKQKRIINASRKLAKALHLEGAFGFQFIKTRHNIPYIIECNPRVQGSMVTSTMAGANLIYSAIKYALSEKIPNFNICWKTKMIRFWGFC